MQSIYSARDTIVAPTTIGVATVGNTTNASGATITRNDDMYDIPEFYKPSGVCMYSSQGDIICTHARMAQVSRPQQ